MIRSVLTHSRIAALLVASGLCATAPTTASAAPIPSHGDGQPQLEAKVDALVKATIEELGLPGVSVAVTRKGKLLLAKGYGYRNLSTKKKMYNDTNIRIGSVTKATITGPAAFDVLQKKGIDPKTKKLYGPSGVLGQSFDGDMAIGVKRHTPIIEIAISPADRVFAWYRNQEVSEGASTDLDMHSAPKPFDLPDGKKLIDLRAVSMAKDGKVYSWWDHCVVIDGNEECTLRRAIGTPTDLGKYSGGVSAEAVQMPDKYHGRDEIVGIGIAKSNDHVYIWFEDGTYSSGTSTNFTFYEGLETFTPAAGCKPYEIRGMDIAKNDHVYAWCNNGKASAGMSHDLDKYLAPYAYTIPPVTTDNWTAWYKSITLQNLLDHKAGFEGSGDDWAAMKMFGVSEAALTYTQVHKEFLRTRRLLSGPGTKYEYSNHGFGLWTLLIEKLTGTAYYPHVRDKYLAPKGLDEVIVPETTNAGSNCRYASNHSFDGNGVAKPSSFEQWGLGLAAGGFRASALHLVLLMKSLAGKYTNAQLDQMGWGGSGGKLAHSGSIKGGSAYALMFADGYKLSGKDVGGVHVVIISNVKSNDDINVGDALSALATKVATAVPDSNIAATYELPKPFGPSPCLSE